MSLQGSHKLGKPAIVREFCKPGKVMEFQIWSDNFLAHVTLFVTCCPIGSPYVSLQLLYPRISCEGSTPKIVLLASLAVIFVPLKLWHHPCCRKLREMPGNTKVIRKSQGIL